MLGPTACNRAAVADPNHRAVSEGGNKRGLTDNNVPHIAYRRKPLPTGAPAIPSRGWRRGNCGPFDMAVGSPAGSDATAMQYSSYMLLPAYNFFYINAEDIYSAAL
jgi:hypothetical protein